MKRLIATIKNDVIIQVRTQLYTIGIASAILVALAVSWLAAPEHMANLVPALLILVVGGSTLLYVSAVIIFERDEGTLAAMVVSPLKPSEYILSKLISLNLLALLESALLIGGALGLMAFNFQLPAVNIPDLAWLIVGNVGIGTIYTLIGIILVVRYDKITEFLIPVAALSVILQLSAFHFLGVFEHWGMLIIPTSAPAMLVKAAFTSLEFWEWIYAFVYTGALITGLSYWASGAFTRHVLQKLY